MDNFDKPFLSYDEMIDLLKKRGLLVNDLDFARSSLGLMSYYNIINGYLDSRLYNKNTETFVAGLSFEDLFSLHLIDSSIDALVLKNILYIEIALKSRVSYIVSREHGVWTDYMDLTNSNPDDYLFRGNYNSHSRKISGVLWKLKKAIREPIIGASSINHYKFNHNHIPAWILVSGISFNDAIQWFMILNNNDKTYVANEFIPDFYLSVMEKKEYLRHSLNLMKNFRNKVAHGHPTFSIIDDKTQLPKKALILLSNGIATANEYTSIYARSGLYGVIASVFSLLGDEYLKGMFYAELSNILKDYIDNDIRIAGIPILDLFHLPNDILCRMNPSR